MRRLGASVSVLLLGFAAYARSPGKWLFAALLLIMIVSGATEVSTDAWIKELMQPEVEKLWDLGLDGGWVLVYTAAIMMVLRFCAGPIVHRISPLGLLAVCSAIAALGLFSLSFATGIMILVPASIYGVGKTFFWPTMLGVVAERFPKGGKRGLPTKTCIACGRPFQWRRKWQQNWEEVAHCSQRCRDNRNRSGRKSEEGVTGRTDRSR